jgi:hypothetical protein
MREAKLSSILRTVFVWIPCWPSNNDRPTEFTPPVRTSIILADELNASSGIG